MNAYQIIPPSFGNWKVLRRWVLELIDALCLYYCYLCVILFIFIQYSYWLNVIWQRFCDLNCLFACLFRLPALHLFGRGLCLDCHRCGLFEGEILGLWQVIWRCFWKLWEIPGQCQVNFLFSLLSVWFRYWASRMLNGTPDQSHLA